MVWSANCGWISLSNAFAYVQTDTMSPGALAPDGLPIAWLLTYFGTTNVDANADPTTMACPSCRNTLAGTNPNDANSVFRHHRGSFASRRNQRQPHVEQRADAVIITLQKTPGLNSPVWMDSGLGLVSPSAGATHHRGFPDTTAPLRFYHVRRFCR